MEKRLRLSPPGKRGEIFSPLDRIISTSKKSPIEEETIAAISTPYGESGIGIVRVSDPLAEPIARRLFKAKKEVSAFISHHFHYGEIIDPQTGHPMDEVLIVLMRAPKTYTKEDIVEIHCHGGISFFRRFWNWC